WKSILTDFGASVSQEANRLTVEGKSLRGITRDMSAEGELVPTVVALALFAEGPTHLYGIGHLRGHETDRLAALACEGCKLGAQIEEGPDFLTITPGTPRPA
ncbi:3-phosphoshikimate 1-carboxyvinyltransferase, partial [Actinotignum timonense]|nr:3-phosphoshikimate 1-carboxyvinyltransferase [Actinotignum timonense]